MFFSYIGARTHGSVLFFIFSSCPEQVLDFFLRGRLDRGSLLKFDLATVRALVWQRLCLKAVMADIAEIVIHCICTSNLCFIISIISHRDTFLTKLSCSY